MQSFVVVKSVQTLTFHIIEVILITQKSFQCRAILCAHETFLCLFYLLNLKDTKIKIYYIYANSFTDRTATYRDGRMENRSDYIDMNSITQ
jgi:hypothetical protein